MTKLFYDWVGNPCMWLALALFSPFGLRLDHPVILFAGACFMVLEVCFVLAAIIVLFIFATL